MTIVEIHLIKGYDEGARIRLGRSVTDAVRLVVPAHPDLVTTIIHEGGPGNYLRGGKVRKFAPALPDPCETVRMFLAAMEARDLQSAAQYLGEGFTMRFPASEPIAQLSQLTERAATRYRSVSKSFDAFEAMGTPGPTVVYVRGTLSGEWLDGTLFNGIRFIDRFELTDGKITRQDVWNDLGEYERET